jgi:type I restriction enzyme M protein
MMEEQKREELIPDDHRWSTLKKLDGMDLLGRYRQALLALGDPNTKGVNAPLVREIFTDAQTSITQPTSLRSLFDTIDQVEWYSLNEDGIGDLYEGLLERTASERKSKAGQYFTPRPLIDCIVRLMRPKPGEIVQDPAAGTGGFLIAANEFVRRATDDLFTLSRDEALFQRGEAYAGLELINKTHRLCLMNLMLHRINAIVGLGDALTGDGERLKKAHIVLTNPPFNKFPERVARADFVITAGMAKGPLPFLEHVVRALRPGGRAAIVAPDGTLGNDEGLDLRRWLMDLCDLHTILRLPTGIFYSQGVKTNVLFFTRGAKDKGNTKETWIYDMRAGQPAFGKTRTLTANDFAAFENAFGVDPDGKSKRKDEGEQGRLRKFTREEIARRGDNLDIGWLREDESKSEDELAEPDDIADAIAAHLRAALIEVETLGEELRPPDVELRP